MAAVKTTSMKTMGMNLEKTTVPSGNAARLPIPARMAPKIRAGMANRSGKNFDSPSMRPITRGTA